MRVGDLEYPYIPMECVYYPDRGNASWTWVEPESNNTREDLPTCLRKCKADPLNRSDLKRNWTTLVNVFTYLKCC